MSSVFLSVCPSIHLFVCLPVCQYISLFLLVTLFVCLPICPFVLLSFCPSVLLSVYSSICLFHVASTVFHIKNVFSDAKKTFFGIQIICVWMSLCYHLGQCFPKSGPRTIFGPQEFLIWSARIKIVAVLSYFAIKRVSYVEKLPSLWSAEDFVEILWSAKFFFPFYGPQAKKVWETLI